MIAPVPVGHKAADRGPGTSDAPRLFSRCLLDRRSHTLPNRSQRRLV